MEPTTEQTEQLYNLIDRLKEIYPELKDYTIELKYTYLKGAYAQITTVTSPGELDCLQSLKKAKPIFKNYILKKIIISFSKLLLNLKGAVRKDILFYIASHELTHFLELPKNLTSQELGINFDAHSPQFYETHLVRYNQFKRSRNEEPIKDIKQFDQIIALTVQGACEKKEKTEGQIINKKWE